MHRIRVAQSIAVLIALLAATPGLMASPGKTAKVRGLLSVHRVTSQVANSTGVTVRVQPRGGLSPEGTLAAVLVAPNGGESWTGGTTQTVMWSAPGATTIDLDYRDSDLAPWTPIARGLSNTGTYAWSVHPTPTADARVRVVAGDGLTTVSDSSDAVFTIAYAGGGIVATTLRDFFQPGSQPFESGDFDSSGYCLNCHKPNSGTEPGTWAGSMMAQSARDPLFYAALAVAEQDAPSSGDLCIRCHSPIGWLSGHSLPTDASALTAKDRDGVACDVCHRMVDPIYKPGISPTDDEALLTGMLPSHVPTNYSNGQYVLDPNPQKRGPFADAVAPHAFVQSSFHTSGDLCGTCHNVSNPVFEHVAGADYAPGPLDQAATSFGDADLFPVERTYSEWKFSSFPSGVYAPEFAGSKPDGIVASCQDCHVPDVVGKGCIQGAAPVRNNLPFHDMMGGNAWMTSVIAQLASQYPGEIDSTSQMEAAARAVSMLERAAVLDLDVEAEADSFRATVTVTNRTGHKLPTGYPEGRRMWIQVTARDAGEQVVYQSGAYDAATGVLTHDDDARIYEMELGLSPAFASAIGQPSGPSFHFVLNDTIYKDNRIPPLGFTNANFETFGGKPVDATAPAPRYGDGQNWDTAEYALPPSAASVVVTLFYQSTSKEYVEFLRDENTTNSTGQDLYDLWTANGRAAPIVMAADSMSLMATAVQPNRRLDFRPLSNPSRGDVALHLSLPGPQRVALEVFDAQGRRVHSRDLGMMGGGAHRLIWDGRDRKGASVGAGTFWARVKVGGTTLTQKVVRLK